MIRAARAASPALTIAVGLLVSIVAPAAVSGGASALLVVRATVLVVLVLAIAGVLGAVAVAAAASTSEPVRGRLLDGAAVASAAWTVAAAATVFLLYLGEAPAMSSPSFGPGLVSFVADVTIGRTWLVAAAAAAVLTALLVAIRSRRGVLGLAVLSTLAVAPVALQQGISGAALGVERTLASAAFVQLVAITTWIGAAALRSPSRVLRLVCFAAAAIATAVSWPERAADGAATAPVVIAAGAVLVAGALAVADPRRRLLASLEPVLLAAAVALGVVGAVTAPLPPVPAWTTPAEILTGAPLPDPLAVGSLLTAWRPDPLWIVVAVALLAAYPVAVRRVGGRWPAGRTASWIAGAVLLAWLTSGGPARYQEVDLGAHLAQHAALLLVVPVLLAGGSPTRVLPSGWPGADVRPFPVLLAVLVGAAALYGTDALRWSITDPAGTDAMIAACLVLGTLLVRSVGRPGPSRRSAVVAAAVLLAVETGAAALLATGPSLLLADWYGAMGWGTDALAAQRIGALVAWPVAAAPTTALLVAAVRSARPAAPPLDRSAVVIT